MQLTLSADVVQPGGFLGLDASGSVGPIVQFSFDIDGNGSFETKCGNGKAGAVYSKTGTYKVAVQGVTAGGQKIAAEQTFKVAGTPAIPPPGGKGKTPVNGAIVGGCLAKADLGWLDTLVCPRTVVVGVAEATVPANAANCFAFTRSGAPLKGAHVQYVLKGPGIAFVNGLQISPSSGTTFLLDATTKHVKMLGPGRLELIKLGYQLWIYGKKGPISWNVAKPGIVGDVTLGASGSNFLGLDVPEMTRPVKLTSAKTAELAISVEIPNPFDGIASSNLTLRFDNTDGLHIEKFVAELGSFELGPFIGVKQAQVAYERQGTADVWSGAITLTFPGDVAAGGQLRFRNGSLDYLSVFLQKDNPGFPMGCCLYMTYLQGAIEGGGSKLSADAVFSFGPSLSTPWGTLRVASVDPAQLKILLGSFVIQVKGDIKVVGKKVGNTAAMLTDKQFFFYGALNDSFLGVIDVGAVVTGSIYANGTWYVGGSANLCVTLENPIKDISECGGGAVALSNKGVAGCIGGAIGVGAYVRWSGAVGPLFECSWDIVKSEAGAPALRRLASGAATSVDVKVPAGAAGRLFRIAGRGAPPQVLVAGPDGRRIDGTAPYTRTSGHLVLQAASENATYVAVMRPAAGTWKISAAPGSAPIVGFGSAGPLPKRIAIGSLRTAGAARTLHYRLAGLPGFSVTFVERGKNVDRMIGRARGRSGTLRFTPAEMPARARRVEAVVERDGIPVRTEVVARYRTPPLRPLPAPMIAVSRRGTTVVARWLPVGGARGYRAFVTPGDGRTRFFELPASRSSVRLSGVGLRAGATVTVRALSRGGRPGRLGRARLVAEPSVRLVSAQRDAIVVRCVPGASGVCSVTAALRGKRVATGSVRLANGKAGVVRARLTRAGRKLVRGGAVVAVVVEVPGEGSRTLRARVR